MNRLNVFAVSAVALFASMTVQAEPVIDFEIEKDHNFYHVTLNWYDVNSEFVTIYLNSNDWGTFQTARNRISFYSTRTRRNQPKVFWVCEAETDVCSDPVALSFKGNKPMQGNKP